MNKDNIVTFRMYISSVESAVQDINELTDEQLEALPDECMEALEPLLVEADDAIWAVKDFHWEG